MVTTNDELLGAIVARILQVVTPNRIVVYGSRARGDARRDSDVDVLLIADSPLPRWKRTVPLLRALRGIDADVDLTWWTPSEVDEWRNVRSHLVSRALAEGRVVYENAA